MRPFRVEERRVASFDGTALDVYTAGEGLPVLLFNGIGGGWRIWNHQVGHLADRYRFLSWDYRGLYGSDRPVPPATMSITDHARDAIAVLDFAAAPRAALCAWSFGVPLALEMFRIAPDRVAALVFVNGGASAAWPNVLNVRAMGRILPWLLRTAEALPDMTRSVARRVARSPETVSWVRRLGLAARTLDDGLWSDLAESFDDLDMETYVSMLARVGSHDAVDVLKHIDVPVLVVAGDRDLIVPRRVGESLVRHVRGAELMVVPGGTHYVPVEYPELLSLRIEKFFQERGYMPVPLSVGV
jgi:pimeloyl-ACP methyl ester carboxylesterase